jgi:hypothetical protein
MRAQGKPIWILVTLLLALVVAVTMYGLVAQTGSNKTFDQMMTSVDSGTAQTQMLQICKNWHDAKFAVDLTDTEVSEIKDYAAKKGWLTDDEWEDDEDFTSCDCAMFLYTQEEISSTEVNKYYDPDECHEKANTEAEDRNIKGAR